MKQHLAIRFQLKQLSLMVLFCVSFILQQHAYGQDSSTETKQAEDIQAEDTQAEDTQAEDTQAEDTQAEDTQAEDTQSVSELEVDQKAIQNTADAALSWQKVFQSLVNDLVYYDENKTKSRLRPDIQNGLIRVAVLTTQGNGADEATRQAIAQHLALLMTDIPNVHILEPSREQVVLKRFSQNTGGLKLTVERSISLGQHLGVRYLLLSEISSETKESLKLKIQLVSIKGRGEITNLTQDLAVKELNQFKTQHVFYEKKLGATWRSALLPGLGQWYQGEQAAAVAYMTLSAGLLMGGIWATQQGNAAANEYQKNTSDKIYYRQIANNHYARAQLLWGALGATWLSATLSAYLQGEDKAHLKFDINPAQGSLGLSGVF